MKAMLPAVITILLSSFVCYTSAVFASNQCLNTGAFYNDTSKSCQCSEGYVGLGDLCCDDASTRDVCSIRGDPILTSFSGAESHFAFPCVSRVATVTGTTSADEVCRVEVMNTGEMVENGLVYSDRIAVVFKIAQDEPRVYRFFKDTFQRPGDAAPNAAADLYRRRLFSQNLSGETITISYVPYRKYWKITGCGTSVTFRAAQSDQAKQEYRPGICVSKKIGDQATGDACGANTPQNAFDILFSAVNNMQVVDSVSKDIHPDYRAVCDGVQAQVQGCGPNLRSALGACGSMIYNPMMRLCLSSSGVTGPELVALTSDCINYKCQNNYDWCNDLLARSAALQNCFPSICSQ